MKRSASYLLLLLGPVLLIGCDGGLFGSERPIAVGDQPADTTLRMEDRSFTVRMGRYFGAPRDAGVAYSAEATGDAVSVALDGDDLTVFALGPGTATIRLGARGLAPAPLEAAFDVRVVCPVDPDTTFASYFRHGDGQTWVYRYDYQYEIGDTGRIVSTSGDLAWTVVHRRQRCDEITLQLSERFEGVRVRRWADAAADTTYGVSWERTLLARLAGNALLIEGYTDGTFAGLDSLRWLYPIGSPETVAVERAGDCPAGQGCLQTGYALTRNRGLSEWHYELTHPARTRKSLTLLR